MMIVTRLIYDSQGRYAEAEPLYARGCSCGARCWASAIPTPSPASTTWPDSPEARRDDSQRMVIRVEARSSLLDDLPPARGCSVAEMVRIGARRFHVERGGQTGIARYTCPDEPAMEKILQ